MNNKSLLYLGMFVGSVIGTYLPTLFGIDAFSVTSVVFSGIGGIAGIYIMYKVTQY